MLRTFLSRRMVARLASLSVLCVAAACGGKELKVDEALAVFDAPVKIVRDETLSATVGTHLLLSEKPTVATFSVLDLPEGVNGSFDPPTVDFNTAFTQNVEMQLTAARTAPTGTYTAVVRRTNDKGGFYTDNFQIQIVDFAVAVKADDNDISINDGSSDDTKITITRRGNSNGTVELSLGGKLPNGVSWDIDPPRVLIDADHPVQHAKLTLSADSGLIGSETQKCYVKALKGPNVDVSGKISVTMNGQTADEEARKATKHG